MMRCLLIVWALIVMPNASHAETPAVLLPYTKPTLIAHRGASWDAPEHTVVAYELALKQGADFVEPDLQLTKDGELVCLHDLTLERTTNVEEVFPDRAVAAANGKNTWPVANFTLAEIQQLDAGSWKGAQFVGARVPTLQQMIDLVRGKAGIIPETKAPEIYGKRGLNMERALMKALQANRLDTPGADPATPVIIQSFSAASLQALRNEHDCKLPLVFLFSTESTSPQQLERMKQFADGIAPNKSVVHKNPGLVADAHQLGLSVTVWTFRPESDHETQALRDEMRRFLYELRVDAVFTDAPALFPRS